MDKYNLNRFVEAQNTNYQIALEEIKQGHKQSHWMWYIFPQIHGLGMSSMSVYYSIKSKQEAIEYMKHPLLSKNLIEITKVLCTLNTNDSIKVFGTIDSIKLQSCMTLFNEIKPNELFQKVLNKYYDGNKDLKTLQILKQEKD